MRLWQYILLSLLFPFLTVPSFAQKNEDVVEKQRIIEQRIEFISENLETEDIDLNTVLDNLYYYIDHPINLNFKNAPEKLQDLGLLTDIQINNLNTHIINYGKLISIYELQAVKGFSVEDIKLILPFVQVDADLFAPKITWEDVKKEGSHEIITRFTRILEEQKGYQEKTDSAKLASPSSYFLGSQNRIYERYRFRYLNNISLGVTAEKDPGEEFFRGSQPQGFDFYSAHFYLKNFNRLKALALGDFQAQFGQGLTLWSGLAFGKTVEITSVKRNGQGIRPYTSVDESRFMRGGAVAYELGKFTVTALASHKNLDANIAEIDTFNVDSDVIVSSFQQTGFHRTNSEVANKNAIKETHVAGNVSFDTRSFHLGSTVLKSNYSAVLQRNESNYNQFDFNGNENLVAGVDMNWIYQNLNVFGESSYSQNGAMAHSYGALLSVDPRLNISALYRKFDRDFQNLLSNGFGESSRTINEQGLLMGFDMRLTKSLFLNGYIDQYEFEWLRFQTDKPFTSGHDFIAQLRYKPNKILDMYFRYRFKNKPINSDAENIENITPVFYEERENIRFNIDMKAGEGIRLRSRVELLNYERIGGAPEKGFLAYQDVHYTPKSKPYSFKIRYTLFDTDSYSSRIYAYENDLLYLFSVPANYNRGSRYYVMFRYKFLRKFDLWLRYSRTVYENLNPISSGLNQIDGNTRSELKAQLIIKI